MNGTSGSGLKTGWSGSWSSEVASICGLVAKGSLSVAVERKQITQLLAQVPNGADRVVDGEVSGVLVAINGN